VNESGMAGSQTNDLIIAITPQLKVVISSSSSFPAESKAVKQPNHHDKVHSSPFDATLR